MRPIFLLPLGLFALLALAMGAVLLDGDRPGQVSPLIGRPAPDFALPGIAEGAPGLARADFGADGAAVVNFWASWCAPCRIEHPILMQLAADGVPVYGIAYKDDPEKSLAFLDELGDPFARTARDETGRVAIDFGVTGVPETFVVGADGMVRARWQGPLTPEVVRDIIRPALDGRTIR